MATKQLENRNGEMEGNGGQTVDFSGATVNACVDAPFAVAVACSRVGEASASVDTKTKFGAPAAGRGAVLVEEATPATEAVAGGEGKRAFQAASERRKPWRTMAV